MCIHRKDFNLRQEEQSVDFLREMYNLETQINKLAGELDKSKWRSLASINVGADHVLSLSPVHLRTKTLDATRQDTTFKEHEGADGSQNLGIFDAEDIQNILREMNYKIQLIPLGVRTFSYSRYNVY